MKTREQHITRLKFVANLDNSNGNDSVKRSAALEALVGPADGAQTDRLVKLVIAVLEAQGYPES